MGFDNIIGQEKVKKRLNFFLEGQAKSRLSPHILFSAARGSGKTLIAQTYADQLINSEGKIRRRMTINCSSIKTLKRFVNDILAAHVIGKEITILFDEASEIPEDMTMALLTILNPNQQNSNSFSYDDLTIDFDFKNVTFLFATTEAHKINPALMDRLERVDLEQYSIENLSAIVQKNSAANITDVAIEQISKVLRGNARKATQMANHIALYLSTKNKQTFDIDDWKEFCSNMGINPLGLSPMEIRVLQCLAEKSETTLTNLSAKTHMTRESLQRDIEMYLQKTNLMEVTPTGRKLTHAGRQYLENLK
jgi:Holliday junction resolvasome RuvABC ATP-dependent DNA helicase subunit